MRSTKLTDAEFIEIISKTPLISIDLVIRNKEDKILMGQRLNEPARGKWFVPGGRIRKNECLEEAFERVSLDELGQKIYLSEARLLGLFTHKYNTNYKCIEGISTHYVVLAYEIFLTEKVDIDIMSSKQHSELLWLGKNDPVSDVHPYSSAYFNHLKKLTETQ